MAVDFGQRYVTKSGNDSNDGLTIETSKLTVANAVGSLPTSSGYVYGHVLVGQGDFVETALPIRVTRTFKLSGMNTGGGFATGTRIIQGAANHLFTWESGADTADQFAHWYGFEDVSLIGDKATFPGDYDLLQIIRPGFNCRLNSVYFRTASRYGLSLWQGGNSFYGAELGFDQCNTAAIYMNSDPALGGQAFAYAMNTIKHVQIDNCGPSPITIDLDTTSFRSTFSFTDLEYETASTSQHNNLIDYSAPSGANSMFDVTQLHVSDFGGGGNKSVINETGADSAQWTLKNINNWNNSAEFDFLFNGNTESYTGEVLGFGVFQSNSADVPSGTTQIVLGGVWMTSSTSVPTFSAPTGSLHMRRGDGNGQLYSNTSATSPGTTWTAR